VVVVVGGTVEVVVLGDTDEVVVVGSAAALRAAPPPLTKVVLGAAAVVVGDALRWGAVVVVAATSASSRARCASRRASWELAELGTAADRGAEGALAATETAPAVSAPAALMPSVHEMKGFMMLPAGRLAPGTAFRAVLRPP